MRVKFVLALLVGLTSAPALAQPSISVAPTSKDYGNVDVGGARDQTFRIRNTGSEQLVAVPALMFGVHFSISTTDTLRINSGSFFDVLVRFEPIRPGAQFDSLLIVHNAPNTASPLQVSLRGVGIPRPEVSVRPSEFDFDTVAVRTSKEATFWVGNPGSGLLTARASISQGGAHYEVISSTEIFQVPAGDSLPVVVRFAPLQPTRHTGRLRIDHNGVNAGSPVSVTMTGLGAQAITIDPNEPNNTADESTLISTGFFSDSTEIWPNGDVDYFAFEGVLGEWLTISVDVAGSRLNSKVWLYDGDGNLLAENDNAGSTDLSQINDTLRTSGTHYIRVAFAGNNIGFPNGATMKSAGEDPIGEYRLSLVRTGADPLGTPDLVTPADSVFNQRVDPLLSWTAVPGAKTYDVIVARSPDFAPSSIVFQSSRQDTSVVTDNLPAGTVLYWHVRAGYELGVGEFSEPRLFQTTFAPVVISPIEDVLLPEGSQDIDLSPVFADPEGGALTYAVVGVTDSSIVGASVAGSTLTLTQLGDGFADVSVGATDPEGAQTTTTFSVIAGLATSNEASELPLNEFAIGANYPNPFTGSSILPVSLPVAGQVTAKLFDLLGSEVATITSGRFQSGRHEFEIRADDLAPGVYVVRIEAGGDTRLRSIVVSR